MQRCKSVDLKLNHKKRDLYDYYFVVTKSGQALPFVAITELFTFVGISGYFGTTKAESIHNKVIHSCTYKLFQWFSIR